MTLLFFFGHGLTYDKGDFYLATSDLDPSAPLAKGIPYRHLTEAMRQPQTSESIKVIILDYCHSDL